MGPTGDGAHEQDLVEGYLSLEYLSLGQTETGLQIERRQNFPAHDGVGDVGRCVL